MTGRYPIVEHRKLRPFFRQPPTAGEFETLVYEIGSDFVTGETDLTARARSVCVVDLRRNVRVEVRRGHNTAIYRCTVEDSVAVAKARRTFAVRDLRRFLARGGSAPIPGLRVVLARLYVPSGYSSPVADDDDYTEA